MVLFVYHLEEVGLQEQMRLLGHHKYLLHIYYQCIFLLGHNYHLLYIQVQSHRRRSHLLVHLVSPRELVYLVVSVRELLVRQKYLE